jgi:hypothetical protein
MTPIDHSPEIHGLLREKLNQLQPVRLPLFSVKLLGIHALATLLTLSICPQFGVEGLKSFFDLSEVLMRFGHTACQAMCGMIYFSISMATASLVIRREELFFLKRHRALFSLALVFFSFGFFVMNTSWELEVPFVTAWMIGGLAGSFFSQFLTFKFLTRT